MTSRYLIRNIARMLKNAGKLLFAAALICYLTACSTSGSPLSNKGLVTSDPPANNASGISFTTNSWPTSDNPAAVTVSGNLWDDMQDYLQLPDYSYRPEVQKQIAWFQSHQGYLNRIIKQAAPYLYYIFQQTKQRNLPAELALLPMIESAYNPFNYSRVGANGLWQIMPGTASGFGLKIDWWYDGRRDLIASTKAALDYLAYLNDFFTHNWILAIAAYDSGEGTVQDAVKYNKKHHRAIDFWSLRLPKETKVYVPKLLALASIIRDPDRYNINLLPINDAPYLQQVNIGSQIALDQAAKLAGVSLTTLRKLNPGFRRWATDPNGPYSLLLPSDKASGFMQRLNALPKSKRVTWQEHTVKLGDTLGAVAHKYKTRLSVLKQVNRLRTNIIRPGRKLLIPVAFHGSLKSPVVREHATIAEEQLPGPHRVVYIVHNGDTLWTIAQKFGITVKQIRFWNNLGNKHKLTKSEKLLIWAPTHHHLTFTHHYIYKVMPGDSLYVIAKRFNSSASKIRRANHLRKNIIHAGQILHIPGRPHHITIYYHHDQSIIYKVKAGDNLKTIAHRFHTTSKSLKQWNHLAKAKYIRPKQKLRIYRQRKMPPHTHYLVHIVRSGDNLQKIAHKFGTTLSKLKKWNQLTKNRYIRPGQKIYIYYKDKGFRV